MGKGQVSAPKQNSCVGGSVCCREGSWGEAGGWGGARSLRIVWEDFCGEVTFEQKPQAWEELLEENSGLRKQRMPRPWWIQPGLQHSRSQRGPGDQGAVGWVHW